MITPTYRAYTFEIRGKASNTMGAYPVSYPKIDAPKQRYTTQDVFNIDGEIYNIDDTYEDRTIVIEVGVEPENVAEFVEWIRNSNENYLVLSDRDQAWYIKHASCSNLGQVLRKAYKCELEFICSPRYKKYSTWDGSSFHDGDCL